MWNPLFVIEQTLQAVGLVAGVRWGIEEPHYEVEAAVDGVEIRRYGPRIAAETVVHADDNAARNIGFHRLAGYIFGGNQGSTKIAMTAPVVQSSDDVAEGETIAMTAPVVQTRNQAGQSVIRFFMPSEWSMQTLPKPSDEAVTLVEVPSETVAVLGFSGDRSPNTVDRRADSLQRTASEMGYEVVGKPVTWLYDPPFTLPCRRRNEVAVQVALQS